jgi:hypothetical protein
MATIREVLKSKLDRFNVDVTDIDLDAMIIEAGLIDGSGEYTVDTVLVTKKALTTIIPELLVSPSISEGGYSIKWDVNGLKEYYAILCEETGEQNKLSPKVKNISNRW